MPPYFFPNGQRNAATRQLIDSNYSKASYEKALTHLKNKTFSNFEFEYRRIEKLREIKAYLDQNNKKYFVFVNPLNLKVIDTFSEIGLEDDFALFKSSIASVFPDYYDFSRSEWSSEEYFFWTDPWHYRPSTGRLFLDEILSEISS
jgi:hypothetical protein